VGYRFLAENPRLFLDGTHLDVAERNRPMIPLQGNAAKIGFGKTWHLGKFAGSHALVEIVAVQDVFKVLDTVDVVLAFFWGNEEADMVPFADRLGGIESFAGVWVGGRLI